MKRILLTVMMVIPVFVISFSQEYFEVLTLPRPDCSGKIWQSFYDHADKIMVISDQYANDPEYKRMYGYFMVDTALCVKKESELTRGDYKKPLLLFGPIHEFLHWEKFKAPVERTPNGFRYNNKEYDGRNDGINYISPDRLIYTGNSLLPVWELQSTPCGLYHYVIVRNSQITTFGEYQDDKPFEIDLIAIRNTNYSVINTRDFKFYVSKKLDPDEVLRKMAEIDSIAPEIYRKLNVLPVREPIVCYVHSEPNEATLFANFFFMQGCDPVPKERTFGTVHMKQLHCVGFDIGLIKHEGFHLIVERSIGLSINSFFIEGIQGYFEWGQDTTKINRDIAMLKKHADYDFKSLILNGQEFWSTPYEEGWPIAYPLSGLFVKYLVDTWGFESFKKVYVMDDKNVAFETIYHKTADDIIMDFKGYLGFPDNRERNFNNTFPAPSVDKRIELLSIVFRLAGNWEYSDDQYKNYIADIHNHFDPWKEHELITFARELNDKNGVSFDAVMKMAIHLSQPPVLNPLLPFTEDIPEGRWGQKNATKFVKLLQQFYVDAQCDAFFKAHEQLYKTVPERFKKVYEALDITWYQHYYGVQPNGSLIVILGLGNGCGNYGPKITWPDGREDYYAVIGICPLDSLGEPGYSIEDNLPTLIHEFNHSYVNHLTNQYKSEFKDSGEKLYGIVKESMRRQAYGNWQTMLNEALVRASVVRYYLKHDPDSSVAKAKMITEFNNGFFWINDMVNCLGDYEANRDQYPTLESYMPVLVEFYARTARNTASMFEIKKIVMPISKTVLTSY